MNTIASSLQLSRSLERYGVLKEDSEPHLEPPPQQGGNNGLSPAPPSPPNPTTPAPTTLPAVVARSGVMLPLSRSTDRYGVLRDIPLNDEVEGISSHAPSSTSPATMPTKGTLDIDGSAARLEPITTKQILYLTIFQGVGSGVVNFIINFIIAYAMYHNLPHNTIAFSNSLTCVVSDVTVTSFLIPCLTGLIGNVLIRNDLRVGKLITPIDHRWLDLPIFKPIPTGQTWIDVLKRSIMFGFIGVVVFMPVTVVFLFIASGANGMEAKWAFIAFKGWWGGLEGMLVAPILAFIAIAQAIHDEVQV